MWRKTDTSKMMDRSSSLSDNLKSTLEIEKIEETHSRCLEMNYLGSLQFNARPSSPKYCRTGFSSVFFLNHSEKKTSHLHADERTRLIRVRASFASIRVFQSVTRACIPNGVPNIYIEQNSSIVTESLVSLFIRFALFLRPSVFIDLIFLEHQMKTARSHPDPLSSRLTRFSA